VRQAEPSPFGTRESRFLNRLIASDFGAKTFAPKFVFLAVRTFAADAGKK
jgi:hypothetical protein